MNQYLYVCLFSNGHIKVGRSINPESRIAVHEDRVSCLGVELIQHAIFPCVGHVIPAEKALIEKCRELSTANHKTEWFEGLDFDDVFQIAQDIANKEFDETIIDSLKRELRAAGSSRWEAIAAEAGVAKTLPRKIAFNDRDNPGVQTIQPLIDYFKEVNSGHRQLPALADKAAA